MWARGVARRRPRGARCNASFLTAFLQMEIRKEAGDESSRPDDKRNQLLRSGYITARGGRVLAEKWNWIFAGGRGGRERDWSRIGDVALKAHEPVSKNYVSYKDVVETYQAIRGGVSSRGRCLAV